MKILCRKNLVLSFLLVLLLVSGTVSTVFAAPVITTSLNTDKLPLNQEGQLTVTVTNKEGKLKMPEAEGLRLSYTSKIVNRSSRISNISGNDKKSSTIFIFRVTAEKEGKYTIPPIRLITPDKNYASTPITFEVVAPTKAAKNAGNMGGTTIQLPGMQPGQGIIGQSVPQQVKRGEAMQESDIAFFTIKAKQNIYEGENVPVEIKLCLNPEVDFRGISMPRITAENLAIPVLDEKEAKENQEEINGKIWHTLTWQTTISGIKPGKHQLEITGQTTVRVPDTSRVSSGQQQRSQRDIFNATPEEILAEMMSHRAFGNPFADSFSPMVRKNLTLKKSATFTVEALPEEGRPADFTGAVGSFTLKTSVSRDRVEAGDPLTLSVEVSGKGNFKSVTMPEMAENQSIKTYPPTVKFTPVGSNAGEKIFDQGIIIKNSSVTELPAVSFNYFDPQKKTYVTTSTLPIPLTVTGAASPSQPVPQKETAGQATAAVSADQPLPLKVALGNTTTDLRPMPRRPWFFLSCIAALLVALAAFIFRHIHNSQRSARRSVQRQLTSRLAGDLASVDKAQQAGDGHLFLNTCRVAIQNRLAGSCGVHASAVSSRDLREILPKDSVLLEIFQMAENAAYGGEVPTDFEMDQLYPMIRKALEDIK
ncbi:protein BatD [Desulforhopalus vacuolatus]|uniref:BatD family protein n=1 Tax=Desulforhopalus vacuolatus TaxID=40414 RepID=UPI0019659658|nr:BatD family protein [Desulforhopalus vacuolatus]MBM9519411.1 protein BatD [Desulforhopalus vacuolatus]